MKKRRRRRRIKGAHQNALLLFHSKVIMKNCRWHFVGLAVTAFAIMFFLRVNMNIIILAMTGKDDVNDVNLTTSINLALRISSASTTFVVLALLLNNMVI